MKILCVGANFVRHVEEMGGAGGATGAPVWFWKPESARVEDGEAVVLPPDIGAVHHEVELAVRIGTSARRLGSPDAGRVCVDACTVAVDVTARDLQTQAKQEGRPWAQAKGFDTFLPLGPWQDAADVDLQALELRLSLDGQIRQDASTAAMTRDVGRLVQSASQWTTLVPGDVLLTGTPEGVGPLAAGQEMVAELVGHVRLQNPVIDGTVGV